MDIKDIIVGETYQTNWGTPFAVTGKGNELVVGHLNGARLETWVTATDLKPVPKRYEVIGYRLPKKGDLYLDVQPDTRTGDHVWTAQFAFRLSKAFIVKEIV